MGKSLTFRGTVYEASELMRTHRCKDPICDTHLWKVKHELDVAKIRLRKLEEELVRRGVQPVTRYEKHCHFPAAICAIHFHFSRFRLQQEEEEREEEIRRRKRWVEKDFAYFMCNFGARIFFCGVCVLEFQVFGSFEALLFSLAR